MKLFKRIVLLILGCLALVAGVIGILLPIIPTTPFVLVAAACFAGSSEKLYKWILGTKYFGEYINNYRNKTGIRLRLKIQSLIFLWVVLIISAVLFPKLHLIFILAIVGILVSTHILLIKTKQLEKVALKAPAADTSIKKKSSDTI